MKESKDSDLLYGGQTKGSSTLTPKEIAMLRLAKRAGTPLEATAKLILLLRAQKKAHQS